MIGLDHQPCRVITMSSRQLILINMRHQYQISRHVIINMYLRLLRLHHWLSSLRIVLLLMMYHQLIYDIYIIVVYFWHYSVIYIYIYIYGCSMYFMFMLQLYLIYMLVIIMMCILLGHVRYVHLMCSLQIDVYVITIISHEMYIWCLCCDDVIQC